MTAQASTDRAGAYWFCGECIDSRTGFDHIEDAEQAARDHNRVLHPGDGGDDDWHDRMREERHELDAR